jgi:CBS-domain-containing membrane protein
VQDEYAETLSELETALQVRHIAHRPLVTIARDAKPAAAERLASGKTLNNLPVRGADGAIVGVLENINGEIPSVKRPRVDVSAVSYSMRTLDDRIVVESRQSIERLLRDLLSPPYYQLVVTDGRIDGIVTVSDLNKAPVRVLAYATVARLEAAMSVAIRTVTRNSDEAAIQALGEGGAGQVRGHHRQLREQHLNVALLDATTFRQKGIILAKLRVFADGDDRTIQAEFDGLYERLRNPLMHTSPFVGESIPGLQRFAEDLERARQRTKEALVAADGL